MSLSGTNIRFIATGGESRTVGNQVVKIPSSGGFYNRRVNYNDGTGAGNAQKWANVAISLAAGASMTVNLQAAASACGPNATVNFTNIKVLIVDNQNLEQEADTVTITGTPTGGTFTITVAGQTTAGIAYNAIASVVQTAVQGLTTVGSGKATITGSGGGPYVIVFDPSLGVLTVTASGASLTGGSTPAAAAVRSASNLSVGDDSSGSNVWSAPFLGTNARLICQPTESIQKATTSALGYTVDSSHKNLLISNLGLVAITGVLLLCGEGA